MLIAHNRMRRPRHGMVAILVAAGITLLVGVVAIAVDGGMLQDNKRKVQTAADAAALAAAGNLYQRYSSLTALEPDPGGKAKDAAIKALKDNGYTSQNATLVVNIPPKSGPFKDQIGYAEVIVTYHQPRYFSTIWGSSTMPVQARAVGWGLFGGTGNGVICLDPTVSHALDASGTGTVRVTGGAAMVVDSNNDAAARTTGGGHLIADKFLITGNYEGTLEGNVKTGEPPIPDPLAYLTPPTKPAAGTMTTTNVKGSKHYYLTPGSYTNLPNFGNGDTVTLQQGGIYYIDGGGLNSTNGASINMDTSTSGGVMIYNAPSGTQQSQGINISGGTVNLSPLTSGPYAGLVLWQDRTSPVSMSIQGQGGFTIKGTFYAANANLAVSGQGTNTIGSQYISRTLTLSGGGLTTIDYTDEGTARRREIRLVE